MTIEEQYIAETSMEHRKKYAQFFTPYAIADVMTEWILGASRMAAVLEPAIGLGVFSRTILKKNPSCRITGIEIDDRICRYARSVFDEHVSVCNADYLKYEVPHAFDGIIANPPYLKFHDYDNKGCIEIINRKYGYNLSGLTNIYSLFLLKSLHELSDNGRLAYIIPSEFMNTDYGKEVKRVLLNSGMLRYVVVFDSKELIFNDAVTTSCILLCENAPARDIGFVTINRQEDIKQLIRIINGASDLSTKFKVKDIVPNIKWRSYYRREKICSSENLVPFHVFGRVKRGIATGANEFFEFNIDKAHRLGIPQDCLLPCICHCSDVENHIFHERSFVELSRKGKDVYILDAVRGGNEQLENYIAEGEKKGFNRRYLTSKRNPWFSLEHREAAPIWVSVFNRKGLKFVRNLTKCVNLTTFHCIYTNKLVPDDLLFLYLLTETAKRLFMIESREYGNGLIKFEPNDMNHSYMLDLRIIPESIQRDLLLRYHSCETENLPELIRYADALFSQYL